MVERLKELCTGFGGVIFKVEGRSYGELEPDLVGVEVGEQFSWVVLAPAEFSQGEAELYGVLRCKDPALGSKEAYGAVKAIVG